MADEREHRIRERAYQHWESEQRPHGRHDDHWHRAQSEIDEIVRSQAAPAEAAVAAGAADLAEAPKPKRTARRTNGAGGGEVAPPKRRRTTKAAPKEG
ncbi:DUF2934 domain-containing protein [Sphingosinicella terrae]|uniref:DUF2934 domain-containing protein n=1 Tax=Sphingosinicella terrae TaxID=2172047 RepID=UPI0013B4172B|nr:DUF2934 domain-containing protein [Sphingosinicella terrae]